eukprot:TRINITY_DN4170_c0_g3_i2.p1 TRINITY_DN4170_c0_g3~~TRINITY_DN4170_c0_g3_i2.p1  ORF type:complete len:837 (-),score=175.66 TRINITY_DN4170_c0_g3_i2:37-2547(-)
MTKLLLILATFFVFLCTSELLKPPITTAKMRISLETSDFATSDDSSLMVTFWKHCFDADHLVLEKIRLFEQIYDCTQHKTMNDGYQFYQVEDHYIAFFDVVHQHCLDAEGLDFDHDYHCVDHIQYEPLLELYGGAFGNGYTIQETSNCNTQDTFIDSFDRFSDGVEDSTSTFTVYEYDNGVDIYVLDTGVYAEHEVFADGQVIHMMGDGPALVQNLEYGYTLDSHGTHVAGTIAGNLTGLLKGAPIYDYRVCEIQDDKYDSRCYYSLVLSALHNITDRMAQDQTGRRGVINLSIGGGGSDQFYDYYFKKLISLGAIPVAAAGNDHIDACYKIPARFTSIITVGALDYSQTGTASFTNYGECVDIYAPGSFIKSSVTGLTTPCTDCYDYYYGTSMAAPHVSGYIASLLHTNPTITFGQILHVINSSRFSVSESSEGDCVNGCYAFTAFCEKVESDRASISIQDLHPDIEYHPNYEFDINDYLFSGSPKCNAVAEIAWKLYEDYGQAYDVKLYTRLYPTNTCSTFKKSRGTPGYSYKYVCNANGTATKYTYIGETCDDAVSSQVYTHGEFDGYSIFHPYCAYTEEEESFNCGLTLRFYEQGNFTEDCTNDFSDFPYEDSPFIRGYCSYYYSRIYNCSNDNEVDYGNLPIECSDFNQNEYINSELGCYYDDDDSMYNYIGQTCFHNHPCDNMDCNGNGNCVVSDMYTRGSCDCDEFYSGDDCEINTICDECIAQGTSYQCNCSDNYRGNDCEIDSCASDRCNENGICTRIATMPYYECDCTIGEKDEDCYVPDSEDEEGFDSSHYSEDNSSEDNSSVGNSPSNCSALVLLLVAHILVLV